MNYYEHHIRDYDAATAHLTWDQDLAYTRLIRWYYRKEKPIPADIAEACRQIRATSKPQREAVEAVLREFFELRPDGWHKDTCDEIIAAYLAGEPEREAKKKNEDTRTARHRAERSELFGVINAAGLHMAWNTPIAELRAAATRLSGKTATPETPEPVTPETKPVTQPVTAPATPVTATQYPLPTTHSPTEEKKTPIAPKGAGKRFDEFWEAWPKSERKQDRKSCREKWEKTHLDDCADAILSDIEAKRQTRKWQEDDGKFIEAPLVYLNRRRWEDGSEATEPRQEAFV